MDTIVVLGDCQSNGNNCLAHEIVTNFRLHTWSLKFHGEFQNVFKWYLKHRISNKVKDPIPSHNLEKEVWHYFWETELQTAWPNLLDCNIVNFSKNGGHFIGHHYRLKEYLKHNPKPSLVIITDYTFSHISTSFQHDSKRYLFERETYADEDWNPADYSVEVHKKRLASLAVQKAYSRERSQRKHFLGFKQLIKFIKSHNLPYLIVRFGDADKKNIEAFNFMGTDIDCTDLFNQYATTDGEDSLTKLKIQSTVAERVSTAILSRP